MVGSCILVAAVDKAGSVGFSAHSKHFALHRIVGVQTSRTICRCTVAFAMVVLTAQSFRPCLSVSRITRKKLRIVFHEISVISRLWTKD